MANFEEWKTRFRQAEEAEDGEREERISGLIKVLNNFFLPELEQLLQNLEDQEAINEAKSAILDNYEFLKIKGLHRRMWDILQSNLIFIDMPPPYAIGGGKRTYKIIYTKI